MSSHILPTSPRPPFSPSATTAAAADVDVCVLFFFYNPPASDGNARASQASSSKETHKETREETLKGTVPEFVSRELTT